jgi:hypothetical protein
MSFSYAAVGTAAEVAGQLATVDTDNVIGARLAEALVELLGDPDNQIEPASGGQYRYVVKASGHSGSHSTLYLNASVECHWTPAVADEIAEAIEAQSAETGDGAAAASDEDDEEF